MLAYFSSLCEDDWFELQSTDQHCLSGVSQGGMGGCDVVQAGPPLEGTQRSHWGPITSHYATSNPSCISVPTASNFSGAGSRAHRLRAMAKAAMCLCLLQHPNPAVLAPLDPTFFLDNWPSSPHPGGLHRQLPSPRHSLTPLQTDRHRHYQQLLSPPIPSPSLP